MVITVLENDTKWCKPSPEDVLEYAQFLGIDLEKEMHLLSIARDGLCSPVPYPWKACLDNGTELFYFNFETGQSVWDHPCDEKFRNMVEDHRKKREGTSNLKLNTPASLVPLTNPVAPRYLPSPAMESELENMWCGGIKADLSALAEIEAHVETKCDILPQLCCVPIVYRGFLNKLADYIGATQEDIDIAWLHAATDVLGRPAVGLQSDGDCLGSSSRTATRDRYWFHADLDHVEWTPRNYQGISSMGIVGRAAFDFGRYGIGDVSQSYLDLLVDVENDLDDDQICFKRYAIFSTSHVINGPQPSIVK